MVSLWQFIIEWMVETDVLKVMQFHEQLDARGWIPLFDIQGPIQDKEVHIFSSNNEDYSYSEIYKVPLNIYPDFITKFLKIPYVENGIVFPIK